MGKIGKISPIKKEFSPEYKMTIAGSLASNGLTRWPSTYVSLPPYKERDGSYRTGLDENALYIKNMERVGLIEEAKAERARVKAEFERLTALSGGLDLGPRSKFYSSVFDELYNSPERVKFARLFDGPNQFPLDEIETAVIYAYLRVHPDIAPSYDTWRLGKSSPRCPMPSKCKYFVDDEEAEMINTYNQKAKINKAIAKLGELSPTQLLKTARLLGLPSDDTSKQEVLYNQIDTFIKENNKGVGQGIPNVELFMNIASLSDETVNMKYLIREAIRLGIYRKGNGGVIFDGQVKMANNEDDLFEFLSNNSNQDHLIALEERIKSQKAVQTI